MRNFTTGAPLNDDKAIEAISDDDSDISDNDNDDDNDDAAKRDSIVHFRSLRELHCAGWYVPPVMFSHWLVESRLQIASLFRVFCCFYMSSRSLSPLVAADDGDDSALGRGELFVTLCRQ